MSKIEKHHKRDKSWGLKVNQDFFWKVKQTALEERCELVELVEKALNEYMEKHTHTHTHTQSKVTKRNETVFTILQKHIYNH